MQSSAALARLVLASVAWFRFGGAEIFSSIVQFERVLHVEDHVAVRMSEFIRKEEERLEILKKIASDYRQHSVETLRDPEGYLANPLNAFLLVKKFTTDWYEVANLIRNEAADAFVQNITSSVQDFPAYSDFVGSAKALLRLQDTYLLDTQQLARGDVRGISQTRHMTGDDCFQLGKVAYESQDYYHSILWFTEALARLKAEGADNTTVAWALDHLSFSLYARNNVEAALALTEEWLQLDPDNSRALNNKDGYVRKLQNKKVLRDPQDIRNERPRRGFHTTADFKDYEKLCRGEQVLENPFRDQLSCQYKKNHPYFILRPLKEEVMYVDPFIAFYHDVITDTEIASIKQQAKAKLHRSTLFSRVGKATDDYRVSKSAWLEDYEHHHVKEVSEKISAASGLSLRSSEALQVLNYGLGGHYEPHTDYRPDGARPGETGHFADFGNRISTSLYYMTDVEAGGGTVFPHLGLLVSPEKGGMVFWYNLQRNGLGDPRTIHGGCPVLVGSKWVCNKWIHEKFQEFRRLCSTDPGM